MQKQGCNQKKDPRKDDINKRNVKDKRKKRGERAKTPHQLTKTPQRRIQTVNEGKNKRVYWGQREAYQAMLNNQKLGPQTVGEGVEKKGQTSINRPQTTKKKIRRGQPKPCQKKKESAQKRCSDVPTEGAEL